MLMTIPACLFFYIDGVYTIIDMATAYGSVCHRIFDFQVRG